MLRKDICTIDNMAATIGVLIEFWNEGTIKDGDTILIQMHNEVLPEGVPPRFN